MLVVVWAAVLLPIWLRRHDAATESRSVDRFSTAMRVLSRRSAPAAGTTYVMPRRPPGTQVPHVSARGRPSSRAGGVPARTPPTPRDARGSLQARRLRVLVALLAGTGLTSLLALVGVTPWWLAALATLLLIGYVVHLRLQVARSATRARALRRTPVRTRRQPASAPSRVAARVTLPAPEEVPAGSVAEPPATEGWSPIPVPPPAYVTAAVAPPVRPPRERLLPPPVTEPFEPADAEIEVLFERRWAVND